MMDPSCGAVDRAESKLGRRPLFGWQRSDDDMGQAHALRFHRQVRVVALVCAVDGAYNRARC